MKCAILEPLGVQKEVLLSIAEEALGDRVELAYYGTRAEDAATLIERSADADIVVISYIPYGRDIMSKNSSLKMICVAFTGVDHIDMNYCRENHILVSNCSGYANTAVTELVFGSVLSLYRNIIACDAATRASKTKDGLIGFELEGKTFGVIGLGAIGTSVARVAQAFGCRVVSYTDGPCTLDNVEMLSLEDVLRQSDIVSLHVPLLDSTKGLINAENLKLMKKSAVLVNAARGPVVDNAALAQALQEGTIAGAALDVFDMEPPVPSDYPLMSAPNTVLTPHVAFATAESMVKRAKIAFNNVKAWVAGAPQNVM